jgi:UDPglucose 6-dehydrogenase/UDP-N-acetyl-D-galactosamine dehydrogenase
VRRHLKDKTICIVGLGYVGLPLAEAFARNFRVIGFDVDSGKVRKLSENNNNHNLTFTDDPGQIAKAGIIIICVPTPITRAREPDLSYVKAAATLVGQNMKRDSTVILESTVYPGVTEEVVRPILEESGLKCGKDFKLGYSPERISPGEKEYTIDKVVKVVAGSDDKTAELMSQLYRNVAPEVFKARDIRTAEAAKVVENIQRDLNIALMNELSLIFDRMKLSTRDVLAAAATKWNFHRYSPGLVGGYCIPVVPYYLVYKARELGYHSRLILAGRAINDFMPRHVAEMTIKALNSTGKVIKGSRVLIMGLTYKENVNDTRETPAKDLIKELTEYGIDIYGYDPMLSEIEKEFGIKALQNLEDAPETDCVIITVAHRVFATISLDKLRAITGIKPVLIDIRGIFDKAKAEEKGFCYRTL